MKPPDKPVLRLILFHATTLPLSLPLTYALFPSFFVTGGEEQTRGKNADTACEIR